MNRRDFIVGAVGSVAGFALATQPVCAQTRIVTDTTGLLAGDFQLPLASGPGGSVPANIPAYYAKPANSGKGKPPVVLVVSEIFGVHEYIKDVCRRLAKLGYFAVAPDLFVRQGQPQTLESIAEILEKIIAKVPDAQVLGDLDAALEWAVQQGGDAARVGITGFCWGGRITWLYAARNARLKAAVAWYGKLEGAATPLMPQQPLNLVDRLQAPVLGLYAGDDSGIPVRSVDAMRVALQASANTAAQASQLHLYPGVPHAFHADYRPSYRAAEAADGWQRLQAWFKQHGL